MFKSIVLLCFLAGTVQASEELFPVTGVYATLKVVPSPDPEIEAPAEVLEKPKTKTAEPDLGILLKPKVYTKTKAVVKTEDLSRYTPWYEVKGGRNIQTSDKHLESHGANAAYVKTLTPAQKNQLHGKYHGGGVSAVIKPPTASVQSNCPGGNCPLSSGPMRRRGRR